MVLVIKMDAYIHRCLLPVGANYPDITACALSML